MDVAMLTKTFDSCTCSKRQTMETALEHERETLSETRLDLKGRAERAERRCDSLQTASKELTQKLGDTETRFQKVQDCMASGW